MLAIIFIGCVALIVVVALYEHSRSKSASFNQRPGGERPQVPTDQNLQAEGERSKQASTR